MQGVCSIASINLYAEEKEYFLFAYDAPMTFQIHFCLTINQSVTIIFLSCLKYQWPTNHSPIFSVSFGKMEVNANNPHRFIRPLIKYFKLFFIVSCLSFVCLSASCLSFSWRRAGYVKRKMQTTCPTIHKNCTGRFGFNVRFRDKPKSFIAQHFSPFHFFTFIAIVPNNGAAFPHSTLLFRCALKQISPSEEGQ